MKVSSIFWGLRKLLETDFWFFGQNRGLSRAHSFLPKIHVWCEYEPI